jgi:hypothetical protein
MLHMRSKVFVSASLLLSVFIFAVSTHTTAAATTSCPGITRTLALGSRGSDVQTLQQFLIGQNLLAAGNATGYFGMLTQGAVQAWQRSHSIISNGTPSTTGYGAVGPRTRASLAQCNSNTTTTTQTQTQATSTGSTLGGGGGGSGGGGGGSGGGGGPQCTPDSSSPQTQTLACPAGQTGAITQTRTSSCGSGAAPTWSTWATTVNTCKVQSSTTTFFEYPAGFFIVPAISPAQGLGAYGATSPAANWSIAQWGIPSGSTGNFISTNNADGTKSYRTIHNNLDVIALENQGAIKSLSLSQDGSNLVCTPDSNSEYDLFAGPNANDFAPEFPSARKYDTDSTVVNTLSSLSSLFVVMDLTITNIWRSPTPACADVNQRGVDVAVVFNNFGDATHPSQTLFYDITPYLTRCSASDSNATCDAASEKVPKFFYFDGSGSNATIVNGVTTHQTFGYNDLISSYNLPQMMPLHEEKYRIDILSQVKEVIASGPNGMDHNPAHWHLVSMYGGTHIWGNVGISTEWKNLNIETTVSN